MSDTTETEDRFGTVSRFCREGDRMYFHDKDGKELGYIEVVRVPFNGKIRLCFHMDRDIKMRRSTDER